MWFSVVKRRRLRLAHASALAVSPGPLDGTDSTLCNRDTAVPWSKRSPN